MCGPMPCLGGLIGSTYCVKGTVPGRIGITQAITTFEGPMIW